MGRFQSLLSFWTLVSAVSAQASGVPYCDSETGICYSKYLSSDGISYSIALPPEPSNDVILQIAAPISTGWAGLAWAGTMSYNPLTVAWQNGDTVMVSSRMAFGLTYPQPYDGATYTYLAGTGVNETHWILNVRCQGCTSYTSPLDNSNVTLDSGDSTQFAYSFSTAPPLEPANNGSAFDVHIGVGHWDHDLAAAKSEDFSSWVSLTVPETPEYKEPVGTDRPTNAGKLAVRDMPTSCSGVSEPRFPGVTADGWRAVKVAGSLTTPRDIIFDTAGNLLITENGKGITAHKLDENGCISASSTVVAQRNLNHGVALSPDGKTLYASSMTTVWSWNYDPDTMTVSGSSTVLVAGMNNGGHPTRTLLINPDHPNLLVVSHGSNDNLDYESLDPSVGRACVKVFDISLAPSGGYDYASDGYMMGYGLRNEVGLAIDANNMLWGIENSGDNFNRTGNGQSYDVHNNNPAEELHYLGDVSTPNDYWYGYPTCFTVWEPNAFTDTTFETGDQFVLAPNTTFNDSTCTAQSRPATLGFQAHSAPLGIKFDSGNANLYATFHGSWNRDTPTGFKVVQIPFTQTTDGTYEPTAPLSSMSGYTDVFWNTDVTACSAINCFRPVGIAMDEAKGRMYVTSDAPFEGELFLLGKV